MISPRLAAAVAVALIIAPLAGCQREDAGSDPNDPNQIEAVTWWAAGPDQTALYELVAVFEEEYPEIEFIDASVRGGDGVAARAAIAARIEAGNPPDVFQAAPGAALTQYIRDDRLHALSSLFDDEQLRQVLPATLVELVSVDQDPFAVPTDIHRVNVMWSNSEVLKRYGLNPSSAPATLPEWLDDLAALRAAGLEFPLAVGSAETRLQLFEGVLIADLGPVLYSRLWRELDAWQYPDVEDAVAHYASLLEYSDPGAGARETPEVVQSVVLGDAAYVVGADSIDAAFQRAGYTFGRQYNAVPVPGTAGTFDLSADAFVLPVGAVHAPSAMKWLAVAISIEGQRALNAAKGSLPARVDADPADYSEYQQGAIESLRTNQIVPSLSFGLAASPELALAVRTAVDSYSTGGSSQRLLSALRSAAKENLN
ncbi:MAG: ABC transporter substrate-binding protein [Pseudolysinimonas sp.]